MNPYYGQDFLQFFGVLLQRLGGLLSGQLPLATDELQMAVLVGVSLSTAIVGTFLVLRRMAMLANSLSHSILLGIVLTFLLSHGAGMVIDATHTHASLNFHLLFLAAIGTGLVTAFLTEFLTKTVKLQEDASIGLVFNSFFSLGVILVTIYTRNVHLGTEAVMGNVDALHPDDLRLVSLIALVNLVLFALFYRGYKITTFDPQLSTVLGYRPSLYNYLLMLQVSITCVGAFRAIGVLLVLAFLTGPPLIARRLTHRLRTMLGLSIAISISASVIAVALSRHLLSMYGIPLSTSGVVVCIILLFLVLTLLFAPETGELARWRARHGSKKVYPIRIRLR